MFKLTNVLQFNGYKDFVNDVNENLRSLNNNDISHLIQIRDTCWLPGILGSINYMHSK